MDLSDGEGSVTASESEASDTAGGGISGTVDDEAFETLAAEIREVLAELAQVIKLRYQFILCSKITIIKSIMFIGCGIEYYE